MSDKVEIDLEDLDDLKDLIGDERKKLILASRKFFPFGAQLAVFSFLIHYLREWGHSVSAIHRTNLQAVGPHADKRRAEKEQ